MAISFNEVPSVSRVPFAYIEFDASGALKSAPKFKYSPLMIGQRLSTGTIAQKVPTKVNSVDMMRKYFGVGSQLALMAEAWFANNPTEITVIALDDASGGTQGTKTITVTGSTTAAGIFAIYIGGKRVAVPIASGSAVGASATAIAAAINANAHLPFTATAALGVVTLTCKWKGTTGNAIDVRMNYYSGDATPAGASVAIATGVSGATDPAIQDAIDVFGPIHYNVITQPFLDATNLTALKTELAKRWGATVQKEGFCFMGNVDTVANLGTFGGNHNSQFLSTIGLYNTPTPRFVLGAAYAAVVALEGQADPARPLQTCELAGVLAPPPESRFINEEANTLLYAGVATAYVGPGGEVRIQRAITMYRQNALGADDPAYLDVPTLLTLMYLRYSLRTKIMTTFARFKLANDGARFGPGQKIATPSTIKSEVIALCRQWEDLGLVENVDAFIESLIVERNSTDPNRIDILMQPDLVNQMIVAGVQIRFLLQGENITAVEEAATTN